MGLHWSIPVYRERLWIEKLIDGGIRRLQADIGQRISAKDTFPHWVHDLWRPYLHGFSITFGIGIILIGLSYLSSRKHHHITESQTVGGLAQPDSSGSASLASPRSLDNDAATTTPTKTPARHLAERTGRVSTPGYQTPFVHNPNQRNFSGLAKVAPVSYNTLQRNGMLNLDGTPTKKYSPDTSQNLLDCDQERHFYDSLTRTWGHSRPSLGGSKEVRSPADGNVVHWVDDHHDGRAQQFSTAKGKWKAS